jgi:hypothetical protein
MIAAAVVAALMLPVAASAHKGHIHKVLGTVTGVQGNHVEVKTTDGKAVTLTLDATTVVTRGKTKVDAAALKPGERVSAGYMEEKKMNMAKTIKLGETPAPSKK